MKLPRTRISSSSKVFEERGDPWSTDKEGRKNYGRILEIEDVDRDAQAQRLSSQFWDKKLADALRDEIKPRIVTRQSVTEDFAKRKTNIILALKNRRKK